MKISIVVTTFNHEKYIAECLDSILKQKGSFTYEIIIGDDASTDNTRKIINSYRKRFPEIIFLFPKGKNMGVTKNLQRCLYKCCGDYIAICEGDDYWIDERKLEEQMKFLTANPGCIMCFNPIYLYLERDKRMVKHLLARGLKKKYLTIYDLIRHNYIGNFSCCMYRSSVLKLLPAKLFDIFTVDWLFNMTCSLYGKIGFVKKYFSVYRIHGNVFWSGKDQIEQLEDYDRYIDICNNFFEYKYNSEFLGLKTSVRMAIANAKKQKSIFRIMITKARNFIYFKK